MQTADEIYTSLIEQLPVEEQLSLASLILRHVVETKVAPQEARTNAGSPVQPERIKLRGLWKGVEITDEDIDQARQEMSSSIQTGEDRGTS